MVQSIQDIDGDGIADIMLRGSGGLRVVSGSRNGFNHEYTIADISDISKNSTTVTLQGGSLSAGGAIEPEYSSSSKLDYIKINGGIGGSWADGSSDQEAGFIDLNGD